MTIERINHRIAIVGKVNQSALSYFWEKMFLYNSSTEIFYLSLVKNKDKFMKAYAMLERNNIDSAKVILQSVNPEKPIKFYA